MSTDGDSVGPLRSLFTHLRPRDAGQSRPEEGKDGPARAPRAAVARHSPQLLSFTLASQREPRGDACDRPPFPKKGNRTRNCPFLGWEKGIEGRKREEGEGVEKANVCRRGEKGLWLTFFSSFPLRPRPPRRSGASATPHIPGQAKTRTFSRHPGAAWGAS